MLSNCLQIVCVLCLLLIGILKVCNVECLGYPGSKWAIMDSANVPSNATANKLNCPALGYALLTKTLSGEPITFTMAELQGPLNCPNINENSWIEQPQCSCGSLAWSGAQGASVTSKQAGAAQLNATGSILSFPRSVPPMFPEAVDAPDHLVVQATNKKHSSCGAVKRAGLCNHPQAQTHCSASCAKGAGPTGGHTVRAAGDKGASYQIVTPSSTCQNACKRRR